MVWILAASRLLPKEGFDIFVRPFQQSKQMVPHIPPPLRDPLLLLFIQLALPACLMQLMLCCSCDAALARGGKEETADDEDTSPDFRTDSLDQLQQKVPNLMAQMSGIAQNPTKAQIAPT